MSDVSEFLEFGRYRIDREQRLLLKEGAITPLAPKVFDLLLLLAESGGKLLAKESLLAKLWPDTFVEEGSLTRNISTLRKVLGEGSQEQRYISTVPKRGYRFVAEVSNKPSSIALKPHAIAVKALENVSGDNSRDHFAADFTDALTAAELAQIREVRVISAPAKASTLQRDRIVGGSVMQQGNRVGLALAALDPNTRCELWSQRYDRDLGEIATVQKKAACAIAAEARIAASPLGSMPPQIGPVVKPEAFDCYLRGKFYAQRQTKGDNETSILAFERAIALDATFAVAYAELAQAYTWKLFLFAPHERQWEENAFVAVQKALALNPNLALAHLSLGRLLWTPANKFPHCRAIREYRRALALDPGLDEARNQLALVYCHIGYFDDALRESREAVLTNPGNNLAVYRMAQTLAFQGKYQEALATLKTIPGEVNPALVGYQTAWVLFNLGKYVESCTLVEELLTRFPEDDGALFVSMQAVLAASAGDQEKTEQKIEITVRNGRGFGHFHHAAYHVAIAYALLRRCEAAVKWLEFAAADGFPCYPLFKSDRNLDNLRRDAQFEEAMMTLRQQWESFACN